MVKISKSVLYECEKCGWTYKTRYGAEECEKFHEVNNSKEKRAELTETEASAFRRWQGYHEW